MDTADDVRAGTMNGVRPGTMATVRALKVGDMNQASPAYIRELRPGDVAAVSRLIEETIDVDYPGHYSPRALGFFKAFHSAERITGRSEEGKVLVVELEGEIAGTGALVGSEILGVFVSPAFQGRGYGRMLMRKLEAQAVANGCSYCELSVSLPSREFYERLGYRIVEECSLDVGEGQRLDYWSAKKMLDGQEPCR